MSYEVSQSFADTEIGGIKLQTNKKQMDRRTDLLTQLLDTPDGPSRLGHKKIFMCTILHTCKTNCFFSSWHVK